MFKLFAQLRCMYMKIQYTGLQDISLWKECLNIRVDRNDLFKFYFNIYFNIFLLSSHSTTLEKYAKKKCFFPQDINFTYLILSR